MQNFKTLRQPLLGELAMSPEERKKKRDREKNAIYSGHLRLCQQPWAAYALRSDQNSTSHNQIDTAQPQPNSTSTRVGVILDEDLNKAIQNVIEKLEGVSQLYAVQIQLQKLFVF